MSSSYTRETSFIKTINEIRKQNFTYAHQWMQTNKTRFLGKKTNEIQSGQNDIEINFMQN